MGACPSCSTELGGTPKFCPECGTRLEGPAVAARETRRTVTVLFSDVTGSTALGEQLDPEAVRTLMGRYFATMQAVIEGHGGTVEKFIGDAIMAVFGIPVLHEDDALRALRAAAQMREALTGLNAELAAERGVTIATRTGITTGEVVAGDPSAGKTLVTGDTVNTAARLEQAAQPGEILIGEPTWRLVRDAVTVEPVDPIAAKGKALLVSAHRLVSVAAGVEGHLRQMDAPFVGRDRELMRLQQTYGDAVEQRSPQLFTLLGAAGVGKSRLVREFLTSVAGEARVLRGRCLPYGEGITYWPLAEAVRSGAGITGSMDREAAAQALRSLLASAGDGDLIAARLSSAVGLSDEVASQVEVFWAARRLFEYLASHDVVVVLWEDIHWAEDTFLDLVDHLADSLRDLPILLICTARPELLERRTAWAGGKLDATTTLLEPLPTEAVDQLVSAVPGGSLLPTSVRAQIVATAEGNPLFVEELVRAMAEEGSSGLDGNTSQHSLAERLHIPPTITALLASRLDGLPTVERRVAERASIVGRSFSMSAVAHLLPDADPSDISSALNSLGRKELVRRQWSAEAGSETFRFRHVLIRDAAYAALPKRDRGVLHERVADWLLTSAGDRADELDGIVGHHFQQAVNYHRELGTAGEVAGNLANRATAHLAAAGERAFQRDDPAAITLLLAARDVAPENRDVLRRLPLLSIALTNTGRADEARKVAESLVEYGRRHDDEHLIALGEVRLAEELEGTPESEQVARRAIEVLERVGDERGAARAWNLLESNSSARGQESEALAAAERAAVYARSSGDRREYARSLHGILTALVVGPTPVDRGLERSAEIVSERDLQPTFYQLCLATHCLLLALAGRDDDSRDIQLRVEQLAATTGTADFPRTLCALFMSEARLAAGDAAGAEDLVRRSLPAAAKYEALAEMLRTNLARSLLDLGRTEEAVSVIRPLEEAAVRRTRDSGRQSADVEVYRVAADAYSRVGDHSRATELVAAAQALVAPTEWLYLKADVELTRSRVLFGAGYRTAARAAAGEARTLYQTKGHRPGIAAAAALLRDSF